MSINVSTGKQTTPAAQASFKRHTFQITLDSKGEEPIQIEAGNWRGIDHIGMRQLFRGDDHRLYFGKQGFNCPVDDLPHFVAALIECYNQATGSLLSLHGADEDQEEQLSSLAETVVEEMKARQEPVFAWRQR